MLLNSISSSADLNGKPEVELGHPIDRIPLSEYYKKGAHDRIIYSLDNKNPREKYIHEIIYNLDEKIIQGVKKGIYFEIGGKLYRVTDTFFTKWGTVEAKEVHPQNSDDIFARHTFTTKEVLYNMIPENEVGSRLFTVYFFYGGSWLR